MPAASSYRSIRDSCRSYFDRPFQLVKITPVKITVRRSALLRDLMGRLVPQMRCNLLVRLHRTLSGRLKRAGSLPQEAEWRTWGVAPPTPGLRLQPSSLVTRSRSTS